MFWRLKRWQQPFVRPIEVGCFRADIHDLPFWLYRIFFACFTRYCNTGMLKIVDENVFVTVLDLETFLEYATHH
jgi:hypothetical protein